MDKAEVKSTRKRRRAPRKESATILSTDLPLARALNHYADPNPTLMDHPRNVVLQRWQRLRADLESGKASVIVDGQVLPRARCQNLKLPYFETALELIPPGIPSWLNIDGHETGPAFIRYAPEARMQKASSQPSRVSASKLTADIAAWHAERKAQGEQRRPTNGECRLWAGRHGYSQATVWKEVTGGRPQPKGRRPRTDSL